MRTLRLVLSSPLGRIGAAGLLLALVVAFVGPTVGRHGPFTTDGMPLSGPSASYWLGTDNLGRDLYSRIAIGMRNSIVVAFVATLLSATVGSSVGMLAGFVGGRVDRAVMRAWDVVLAFPDIILAIAVAVVVGTGTSTAIIAIATVGMPSFARLARSATRSERTMDYVSADVIAGAGRFNVLRTSVFPNVAGPLVVYFMISLPHAIILEASLSYLGLSDQPPTPSLGRMIAGARQYMRESWWFQVAPILALFLVVVSVMLIGLRVSDVLDPNRRFSSRVSLRQGGTDE